MQSVLWFPSVKKVQRTERTPKEYYAAAARLKLTHTFRVQLLMVKHRLLSLFWLKTAGLR